MEKEYKEGQDKFIEAFSNFIPTDNYEDVVYQYIVKPITLDFVRIPGYKPGYVVIPFNPVFRLYRMILINRILAEQVN